MIEYKQGKENSTFRYVIAFVIIIAAICSIVLVNIANNKADDRTDIEIENKLLEQFVLGEGDLTEIDWETYSSFSKHDQLVFMKSFENADDYSKWCDREMPKENIPSDIPTIDFKGIQPKDFTLEDYYSLSDDERAIFPDYFESYDSYKQWYENVINDN